MECFGEEEEEPMNSAGSGGSKKPCRCRPLVSSSLAAFFLFFFLALALIVPALCLSLVQPVDDGLGRKKRFRSRMCQPRRS